MDLCGKLCIDEMSNNYLPERLQTICLCLPLQLCFLRGSCTSLIKTEANPFMNRPIRGKHFPTQPAKLKKIEALKAKLFDHL